MSDQPESWEEIFSRQYREPAATKYCIAFTPRSGSTWLGDILVRSGVLGEPREYFNREAAALTVRRSTAYNVPDYYRYIKTMLQTSGVFGFEITYPHLSEALAAAGTGLFDDVDAWFFLRRRDYVAQAVSLYRAAHSGVFHGQDGRRYAPDSPYDGGRIAQNVLNLMDAEFGLATYFAAHDLAPVELWYEDLVAQAPWSILERFFDRLGLPPGERPDRASLDLESAFVRLADEHSAVLVECFRAENVQLLDFWDAHRGSAPAHEFTARFPGYGQAG